MIGNFHLFKVKRVFKIQLLFQRFRYWNNPDPDVSLRFKIQDGGRHSPEPAYTETKASILRRRNTLAKMMQQEERIFGRSYDLSNRFMAKNRHWSLTEDEIA